MTGARGGALLKTVLDTNVYVSAFITTRGVTAEIWRRALERKFPLFTSRAIADEVARVLRRDMLWSEAEILVRLKLIARVATVVAPRALVRAVQNDPDDDKILACAVEAAADIVVSGDRHLWTLKAFRGIAIVRPADFLRILG